MKKYFGDKIQILNKGDLLVMKNHGRTKLLNSNELKKWTHNVISTKKGVNNDN